MTCRDCGAPVRPVRMQSGTLNPCQPDPDEERGNILIQRGVGRQLGADRAADARDQGYDLYLSHLAVCEARAPEPAEPTQLELPENVIPLFSGDRARRSA